MALGGKGFDACPCVRGCGAAGALVELFPSWRPCSLSLPLASDSLRQGGPRHTRKAPCPESPAGAQKEEEGARQAREQRRGKPADGGWQSLFPACFLLPPLLARRLFPRCLSFLPRLCTSPGLHWTWTYMFWAEGMSVADGERRAMGRFTLRLQRSDAARWPASVPFPVEEKARKKALRRAHSVQRGNSSAGWRVGGEGERRRGTPREGGGWEQKKKQAWLVFCLRHKEAGVWG